MTVKAAIPEIVVSATPDSDVAGRTIIVTVTVVNPYNETLTDVPTPVLTYSIEGNDQKFYFSESFNIPKEAKPEEYIEIKAVILANDNYMEGQGTALVIVKECMHTGTTTLKWDEEYHWYNCSYCGNDLDKEAHTGGVADCESKAKCEICKVEYGDLDKDNHTHKLEEWLYDKSWHWHSCLCGAHVDKNAHISDSMATEYEDEICKFCGYVMNFATGHIIHTANKEKLYSDNTQHWYKCNGCEEKVEIENHTFGEWEVVLEATETAEGKKVRTCAICSYEDEKNIPTLDLSDNEVDENESSIPNDETKNETTDDVTDKKETDQAEEETVTVEEETEQAEAVTVEDSTEPTEEETVEEDTESSKEVNGEVNDELSGEINDKRSNESKQDEKVETETANDSEEDTSEGDIDTLVVVLVSLASVSAIGAVLVRRKFF